MFPCGCNSCSLCASPRVDVASPPSGNRLRRAAPTPTPSTRPWAGSSRTTPARPARRPRTARSPARSCWCTARVRSWRRAPPTPPAAAAAAAVSGTPRLPSCPRPRPPRPQGRRPPRPPRPWSTTRLHTEGHLTSPASCPSPRAWPSRRGASPRPWGRACTTASWRSPTATGSCRPTCCPTWGASRLWPPWTRRAGAWDGSTSSRAPPPRTPATMERESSAPRLKSKAYLRRKNKT